MNSPDGSGAFKTIAQSKKSPQGCSFGHFGDVVPIGGGLSELHIHEGKGYRIYFRQNGQDIVLLLCGGNKKTQQRDIRRAHEIMKELNNGS